MKPLPFDLHRWARISPRLDELLPLSPERQQARLAEIRANEDAALADDLCRFLALHEQADRTAFMSDVALPASLPHSEKAGDVVGAWTLTEPLGEGGMGIVWHAKRSDDRYQADTAIKLLKYGLFSPTALRRFQREGTLLARLRHPGIAQLLDAGVTQRGQPYLVLELVRGQAIDTWCKQRAVTPQKRIRLFLQAIDAVAAAHRQLIIHRDLKPSNVLVTDDGEVKLLDFGIARIMEDDEAGNDTLTREGAFPYTPRYAAPEQMCGRDLSTATDVYALGVMLYELLTDQHPSGLPAQAGATEYQRAANAGRFSLASARVEAKLARVLRGDIDTILGKALQTEAEERYQSVVEFADDLRRFLRSEPIAAARPTVLYRLRKLLRRRPYEIAAVAVTVSALVIGASLALWQSHEANLARQQALRDLTLSEATNELMDFLLTENGDSAFTTADLLNRAFDFLVKDTASSPAVRAQLYSTVGDRLSEFGQTNKSMEALEAARREAQRDGDPALIARTECEHALLIADADARDKDKAMAMFAQAFNRLAPLHGDNAAAQSECLLALSQVEVGVHLDYAKGREHALQALGIMNSSQVRGSNRVVAQLTVADADRHLGHTRAAVDQYGQVWQDLVAKGRDHSSTALVILHDYAFALQHAGQVVRAVETFETADRISDGLNSNSMEVMINSRHARALAEVGRLAEAERLLPEKKHNSDTTVRSKMVRVVASAEVFCLAKDQRRCNEAVQEGINAHENDASALDKQSLGSLNLSAARLALTRGQTASARQYLDKSVAAYESDTPASPSEIHALLLRLDLALADGDLAAAQRDSDRITALAKKYSEGFDKTSWIGRTYLAQALLASAEHRDGEAFNLHLLAEDQLVASLGDSAAETLRVRQFLRTHPKPGKPS